MSQTIAIIAPYPLLKKSTHIHFSKKKTPSIWRESIRKLSDDLNFAIIKIFLKPNHLIMIIWHWTDLDTLSFEVVLISFEDVINNLVLIWYKLTWDRCWEQVFFFTTLSKGIDLNSFALTPLGVEVNVKIFTHAPSSLYFFKTFFQYSFSNFLSKSTNPKRIPIILCY